MHRGPQVAFLPGVSGSGDFWKPVAARLPAGWGTTCLSWPGAGAEPHDPNVEGYEDLIGMTAATLRSESDLVAQSMGGVVAIGVALAHPDKVRRLVLVATSGGIDVASSDGQEWREEYATEFPDAAPWVSRQRVDYTGQIATITAATCLIWGDKDPISPVAAGQALNELLADSVLHVVPGGTHSLARDRPNEVAALIIDHLA